MRAAWCLAAALVVLAAFGCKKQAAAPPPFERLERAAFAVNLPAWPVAVDEGRAGFGKYKVQSESGPAFAEVAWQGGEALTAAEMRQIVEALLDGFDLDASATEEQETDDQLRVTVTASIQKEVWLVMTVVTCKKTGVLVTLGFGGRSRQQSEDLHARALESLTCRGDRPLAGTLLPASSLPADFGVHREGETTVLAHADGRMLIFFPGASDTLATFPGHTDRILSTFGELLELDLAAQGTPTSGRGLGGVEQSRLRAIDRADGEPLVVAAFSCPESAQGFYVLGLDDSGTADHDALAALLDGAGCPGAGGPATAERKSACEAGVAALCGAATP